MSPHAPAPADVSLKIVAQRYVSRIKRLTQDFLCSLECRRFDGLEVLRCCAKDFLNPWVIRTGRHDNSGRHTLVCLDFLVEIIARRIEARFCFGFFSNLRFDELLINSGLNAFGVRGKVCEGRKAREFGHGAAQLRCRSHLDQPQHSRHHRANSECDRVHAEHGEIRLRRLERAFGLLLWLLRMGGSSTPFSSTNVSSTHVSVGIHP
ncbi:MAG: hypothetical protein WDM89_22380 [Rhizomicrobium sp.]